MMVEQQEWDEPEGRRAEATKRVYRALKIASLITSQPRQWSRSDLAGKLGVGDRTVDRDLEVLRALGYQLARTGDGYVFTHVPAMAPLILSLPEVLALTLAATLARDAGDIDTASLGSALAQLEGLVPLPARPLVRQELLRHAQGGASSGQRQHILETLQRGWVERRRLRIIYATGSRDGALSERTVEPYHVQRHYNRFWIVTAFDHRRKEVIDFKVSRVQAAALLDEKYSIPDDFDITAYRGATWGLLRGENWPSEDVELLFTPQAGRWIQEEDWPAPMTCEARPDRCVLARLTTSITPDFIRWVLWFGPDCQVLTPDSLRQRVRESAEQIAALYARREGASERP